MWLTCSSKVKYLSVLILGALFLWLVCAVLLVHIDYVDGVQAIVNARVLLGDTDLPGFYQRAPLYAFLMLPAVWVSDYLSLHPLNFTVYHLVMAGLHMFYLVYCWKFLVKLFSCSWISLIGFLATIPCFVFFSYAPFISHDIFPGILLLSMLYHTEEYVKRPHWQAMAMLVVLGCAAAILKQTYAFFWIVILISRLLPLSFKKLHGTPVAKLKFLFVAAAISGTSTWLIYAWVMGFSYPDSGFLFRPLKQYTEVMSLYGDANLSEMFPWWLYLRNFHNYGILTLLLIVPGIVVALRQENRFLQNLAIVWVLFFIILHLIPQKEVRYLEFLAPLSAVLSVLALRELLKYKGRLIYLALFVLALDLGRSVVEAKRIFSPFYQKELQTFFSPLESEELRKKPLISSMGYSFTPNIYSPLIADRYHRFLGITGTQLVGLYGLTSDTVKLFPRYEHQNQINLSLFEPGVSYIYANVILSRSEPWLPGNYSRSQEVHTQFYAIAENINLLREGEAYTVQRRLSGNWPTLLMPTTRKTSEGHIFEGQVEIAKVIDFYGASAGDELEVLGFRILVFCSSSGCKSYD